MECNLFRNQNIIYFMSNRWPTFDSHGVQEFFKSYQIGMSNVPSFHSWSVRFSNSCSVLVFFSGGFFKIDLRSSHIQKATSYTPVCTSMCSLGCWWSQPLTLCGWHHHPGLGYWSRGMQWWSRGLGGEERDEIQWYKMHAFFWPMLWLSEKEHNWHVIIDFSHWGATDVL